MCKRRHTYVGMPHAARVLHEVRERGREVAAVPPSAAAHWIHNVPARPAADLLATPLPAPQEGSSKAQAAHGYATLQIMAAELRSSPEPFLDALAEGGHKVFEAGVRRVGGGVMEGALSAMKARRHWGRRMQGVARAWRVRAVALRRRRTLRALSGPPSSLAHAGGMADPSPHLPPWAEPGAEVHFGAGKPLQGATAGLPGP